MPVKIYLIDDDEDDIGFLQTALLKVDAGSVIQTFTDALIAKEFLENPGANNLPDVLVVDHQMPKMLGIDFITWARATEHLRACHIVMYSTDTQHVTDEQMLSLNFTAIAKMNSFDELVGLAASLTELGASKDSDNADEGFPGR